MGGFLLILEILTLLINQWCLGVPFEDLFSKKNFIYFVTCCYKKIYWSNKISLDKISLHDFHFYNCKIKKIKIQNHKLWYKIYYRIMPFKINIPKDDKSIISWTNLTNIENIKSFSTDRDLPLSFNSLKNIFLTKITFLVKARFYTISVERMAIIVKCGTIKTLQSLGLWFSNQNCFENSIVILTEEYLRYTSALPSFLHESPQAPYHKEWPFILFTHQPGVPPTPLKF